MSNRQGVLVGREAQRRRLQAVLTDCAAGHSNVVGLIGEPGIGKSRLLEEVHVLAATHDVASLVLTFRPGEEELPLEAIRRLVRDETPDTAETRRLDDLFVGTGRDVRFQIIGAAIDAMLVLIEQRDPVVVTLEDAQWGDRETLQVIRAVARRTTDMGVGIVVAARPVPRPSGLDGLLSLDGVKLDVIDLAPLTSTGLETMAVDALGGRPGPRLRQQLARTGGNPLIATELLQEVADQELLRGADAPPGSDIELPTGIVLTAPDLDVHVDRRMASLSPTARQIVILCALSDLTVVQLADLLGRKVAALSAALAEAIADGLVREHATRLQLRHDLLRDAVLGAVSPSVRAGLHADLFRLFTSEGADLGQVVPHIVASAGQTRVAEDLKAIADAGRQLVHTAPAVAASLLRRAFLAGYEPARLDLAFALILLGDVAEAQNLVTDQVEDGTEHSVRLGLATAQLSFLAGDLRAASRRFAAVVDGLPADEGLLALAYAALCSLFTGQLGRADRLASRATVPAPTQGQLAGTGTALLVRGWVAALRGDVAEGLSRSREGHQMALRAPGAAADPNLPDLFLGQMLLWNEQLEDASVALRRGMRRSEQLGMGWHQASLHALQALIDIRRGHWGDADAQIDSAVSLAADIEVQHGLPWCLAARARLAIGRGEDASVILEDAQQILGRLAGQGTDVVLWARGLNLLSRGSHSEAAQVLGFLWGRLDHAGLDLRRLHIAPDLMRAAVVADPERAAAALAWLTELESRRKWARAEAVWHLAEGLVAGDTDLLMQARAAMIDLDDPLEAARISVDIHGIDPQALDSRSRAATVSFLDGAGAYGWLAMLEAPTAEQVDRRSGPAGWNSLTPAQARIVFLVGRGLGNAAIAEQLSISRRTVESHLYHVYPKIQVDSRVQLSLVSARQIDLGWDPFNE